jgi:hypothetical protein
MSALPVLVRKAQRSDIPFITSSWLRSNREGFFVRSVGNTVYYHQHHKILEQLLPRSVVLVACNEDDPDQILSWICAEVVDTALVIHYIYTKKPFRKFGLAKRLVNLLEESESPPAIMVTHSNPSMRPLLREKNIIYNPYLLFSSLPDDWNKEDSNE